MAGLEELESEAPFKAAACSLCHPGKATASIPAYLQLLSHHRGACRDTPAVLKQILPPPQHQEVAERLTLGSLGLQPLTSA